MGLDVHKSTIAVAVAEDGKRSEVREHGEIANTPAALTKLLGKLDGPGVKLHICYEAGPCGYGIQRQVAAAGHSCAVVAPSLIPSRPGDRIKTDRRNTVKLARLHRAGELTSVWIPDSVHEAMRDLVRARLAAVAAFFGLYASGSRTPPAGMASTVQACFSLRCISWAARSRLCKARTAARPSASVTDARACCRISSAVTSSSFATVRPCRSGEACGRAGRRFRTGASDYVSISGDEHRLLTLMRGSGDRDLAPLDTGASPGLASTMGIALRSARIMLRLAFQPFGATPSSGFGQHVVTIANDAGEQPRVMPAERACRPRSPTGPSPDRPALRLPFAPNNGR